MEYLRFHVLQLAHGERVRLGQHPLRAVVHVQTVFVLKIHRVAALVAVYLYAGVTHVAHGALVSVGHGCDQFEAHLAGEMVDAVGEVIGGSAVHVENILGRDDLVESDVSYTADISFRFVIHYYHLNALSTAVERFGVQNYENVCFFTSFDIGFMLQLSNNEYFCRKFCHHFHLWTQ